VIGKAKQATGWLAALWARLSTDSEEAVIGEVVSGLLGEQPLIGSVLERRGEAIAGQNAAILIDEAHLIAEWPADQQASLVGAPIDADALGLLLDESRGHPYCTMLLCRASARAGLPGGRTGIPAVSAGLLEVREDEGWELRDA
jgi:hypothetical protein